MAVSILRHYAPGCQQDGLGRCHFQRFFRQIVPYVGVKFIDMISSVDDDLLDSIAGEELQGIFDDGHICEWKKSLSGGDEWPWTIETV